MLTFQGEFGRIDRARINPRPRRQILLWLGGHSEPAFERGARIADGFVFAAAGDGAVEAWGRVQHHLRCSRRCRLGLPSRSSCTVISGQLAI